MHTVCETKTFRRDAEAAGMSDEEIERLVNIIAANPMAGDEIAGDRRVPQGQGGGPG